MAFRNREEDKLERREEQKQREEQGGSAGAGGEKPKRSWKEIDQAREGGKKERDDRDRPRGGKPESAGYRNYKSKLDKLFDGKLKLDQPVEVEVVRSTKEPEKAAEPMPVEVKVLTPKEQLKAAQTDAQIQAACGALLKDGGSFPLDAEALLKVLQQSNATYYLGALEALLDTMEKGRPKNHKLIVARIDEMQTILTGEALDIAKGIRARLA